MEYVTPNGWVILVLTLVIGCMLGLLRRSGGSKWKEADNREPDAHVASRKGRNAWLSQRVGS
jgi:hypothetical protein